MSKEIYSKKPFEIELVDRDSLQSRSQHNGVYTGVSTDVASTVHAVSLN